jgi:hypothetical protein
MKFTIKTAGTLFTQSEMEVMSKYGFTFKKWNHQTRAEWADSLYNKLSDAIIDIHSIKDIVKLSEELGAIKLYGTTIEIYAIHED